MVIKFFFTLHSVLNTRKSILNPFRIFFYIPYRLIMLLYGATVPISSKFKGIPILPHGLHGVFISKDAIIGENVTIFHQVTIGSIQSKNSKHYGSPILGNNILIGAGAKIIGNVKVGNNVNIGANSVVIEDIPDNVTVVGVPSKIVKKNY